MSTPTAIIVAEHGSTFAPWVGPARAGGCEVIVVEQSSYESPSELVRRVRETLEELEATGSVLRAAFVVGGGSSDERTISARSSMVRTLIGPMVRDDLGELVLVGAGRDRYAMSALATITEDMLHGARVRVRSVSSLDALRAA